MTVSRGWKEGTRITFPKEGDQGPNKIPGHNKKCEEKINIVFSPVNNYIHDYSIVLLVIYKFHLYAFINTFNMKLCLKNE